MGNYLQIVEKAKRKKAGEPTQSAPSNSPSPDATKATEATKASEVSHTRTKMPRDKSDQSDQRLPVGKIRCIHRMSPDACAVCNGYARWLIQDETRLLAAQTNPEAVRRQYQEECTSSNGNQLSAKDVVDEFEVPNSPPASNLAHYFEAPTREHLLWLARAVVRACGVPLEEAERHLPVVEAAAKEYLSGVGPGQKPCGHKMFGECPACEKQSKQAVSEVIDEETKILWLT